MKSMRLDREMYMAKCLENFNLFNFYGHSKFRIFSSYQINEWILIIPERSCILILCVSMRLSQIFYDHAKLIQFFDIGTRTENLR